MATAVSASSQVVTRYLELREVQIISNHVLQVLFDILVGWLLLYKRIFVN